MNNLLQILLGLVIAAFITLLAAPYFIDWNQYKSEIEAQASKLIGRPLQVAGDVNLRLLPAPYLQLEDISIDPVGKNTDNKTAMPALLEAKTFRLWLSAPPLLRGVIEVQEIEVVKPHLRFAIDEKGNSNWTNAPQNGASLPFSPTAISLQNMTIADGRVEISTAVSGNGTGTSRTININALNGDFSAGSLKGPYKFDGTIGTGSARQILRVSTGSIDENSQMRVKGILRSKKGGQRYAFDGSIIDLKKRPTMNGVVTASFPFFKSANRTLPKDDKPGAGISRTKPIEVKTSVNANRNGALFDKILVTIVHKNRPQALTGKGRLSWDKGEIGLDGHLNARLIDVDQLKDGLGVGNSVVETVRNLFAGLRAQAAKVDSGRFAININQIKLNGDLVQDLKIDLEQSKAGLLVKKLFANLPGDNMVRINGGFKGSSQTALFRGNGVLRGQSLGHLVNWAAGTKVDGGIAAIRSHPFTLRGRLLFGNGVRALEEVNGDIAGTSFTGKISHRDSSTSTDRNSARPPERGLINLKLTTSEINSTALIGRPVAMREIIDSLLHAKAAANASPGKTAPRNNKSLLGALIADNAFKLQLRAGRLRLDDFDGRDLVADLYFGLKRLQINELSLRSQKGLRLEADGTIINLEKNPSGTLTATANIEDEGELGQIFSWFDGSKNALISKKQTAALTPLRLAIMLQTASNDGSDANIRVNGIAGSSPVSLNNRIIGKALFSRNGKRHISQLEMSGTIANTDGRLLLTQLVPYLPIDPAQLAKIGTGKVWFSAAGLPEIGLNSRVEFNSKRVTASLTGLLGWQNGIGSFNGTTRLITKDVASGLALVGVDTRARTTPGSLDLTATLVKKAGNYDFTGISGRVSTSDVEGRATLDINGKKRKLDLVLLTSSLHIPALFSPLLEQQRARNGKSTNDTGSAPGAGQLADSLQDEIGLSIGLSGPEQKTLMTSRRFTSDLLQGISGQILITADKLYLTDQIIVENGDLSLGIDKRKIAIHNIGGSLWGGKMQSEGTLDLSATLAQVSGKLTIDNVSLDDSPFAIDKTPIVNGKASLIMNFTGRGIGPAGLFSLMNGKGKLKLSNGKINRYSSSVLTDIVDDQLGVWKQSEDKTPFNERFRRYLHHADFALPELSEEFTIKDGTLLLKATRTSKNSSQLAIDTSLSLASMVTRSRLTISPLENAKYAKIPAASVVYEGSLAQLDKITPQIDTASLEQYLQVMKMEHDVNLLEKLHKRDEEFAQKAAERRAQYKLREESEQLEKQRLEALNNGTDSGGENTSQGPAGRKKPADWNPFGQDLGE